MHTNNFKTITLNSRTDLLKLLKGSQYIGQGKTSCCFMLQNGTLLKLYKPTSTKEDLFSRFDMKEHIKQLSDLNKDTYIAPHTMLLYKENVIGYMTEYKKARTLEKIKLNTSSDHLLSNFEKLIEDTYLISEKSFCLGDLHNRNILFNNFFYIIDLDFGLFNNSLNNLPNRNISDILKTILESIFNINETELLIIDNSTLFNLYNDTIYRDYTKIYEFFDTFKKSLKTDNLTIRKLQRSHLYHKEINTYYRYY